MTQSEQEKIIDKIKKLLALAEDGAGATPEEAANAAAKVQELLQKYNLDRSMIKDGPKSSLIMHGLDLPSNRLWTKNLLHVVAVYNFCTTVWQTKRAYVIGEQTNIDAVIALFNHLAETLPAMATVYYSNHCSVYRKFRVPPTHVNTYKANFYRGAINSILYRLHEQQEKFTEQYKGGRALVVANKDDLVTFTEEKFPNKKTEKFNKQTTKDDSGYDAGLKAGLIVEMNKLVPEAKS